jgi:nucleotide-binding universal stress UspA family protein
VRHVQAEGPLVETIVAQADAVEADLIVSLTHGRDGLLDHLRGSTTEQILHHAKRPLLMVPAG